MVCSGDTVVNSIFVEQRGHDTVAEVCASITDEGTRCTEPVEDVGTQKLHNYFGIIRASWYCFNPFRDVVYCKKNVDVAKGVGKWSHKIYAPDVENLTSVDIRQWHLVSGTNIARDLASGARNTKQM